MTPRPADDVTQAALSPTQFDEPKVPPVSFWDAYEPNCHGDEDRPVERPVRQRPAPARVGVALIPLLLRVREAAILLGVSERQVWSLIRGGQLRAIRPPGIRAIRVTREDVEALVARWCGGQPS